MSQETKAAMDAAIAAHVADETGGCYLVEYVLALAAADIEETTRCQYSFEFSEGIYPHHSLGLAEMIIDELVRQADDEDDR